MMVRGVDDRYTIPGSGGVLRNQLGLRDGESLDEVTNDYVSVEWAQLRREAIPTVLDFAYLAQIHQRFFGDVLGDEVVGHWAGEVRSGAATLTALGTGIVYANESYVLPGLAELFNDLDAKNYLSSLEPTRFFAELAESWGQLTQIHPFRDGNTRTQAAYVDRLAVRAGHPIQWSAIDVDELKRLRLKAITRSRDLAEYLEGHALGDLDVATLFR